MSTALSLPTLPSGVTGPSHIPDLTELANIQTALKYLYYGSTGAANSANGIYGALSGLKTYVDAAVSGVNVHENVKAATLVGTPIPGVYAAGTTDLSGGTGIGAKITYSSTGVVTIDGVTLALNDRILVKDGTTALSGINSIANGVYYVSTLGAVGVACVLTRATDSDNSVQGEFSEGDFVFVSGGTTPNNNTSWILTSSSHTGTGPAGSIKIGTDPVTYIQFGAVTWGSQSANTFFAAPNGSSGTPSFRGIGSADLSSYGTLTTTGQVLQWTSGLNALTWSSVPALFTSGGTLTGTLTTAAGTTSIAPLDFNTSGALLTTPVEGAVETVANGIYYTNNPGTTSTGPGRGIITAPHMVFSLASSSTSTTNTAVNIFAAANDVLSVLEPAKLYRFRAKYFMTNVYGGSSFGVNINFAFSNAPTAIKYTFKTYPATAAASVNYAGQSAVTTATTVVQVASSAGYFTEVDGYFTTHATLTSTLTPQFACAVATPPGGGTATMTAGSWIEIEKLGTSTQTLIAGNWA